MTAVITMMMMVTWIEEMCTRARQMKITRLLVTYRQTKIMTCSQYKNNNHYNNNNNSIYHHKTVRLTERHKQKQDKEIVIYIPDKTLFSDIGAPSNGTE